MYSVDRAGRLVMIRLVSPIDIDGIARFAEKTRLTLLGTAEKVIGLADVRDWSVMSPEAAEIVGTMLTRDSPKVERTAIVVSRVHSSLALQLTRLLGSIRHTGRQLFADEKGAIGYLADLITPAERRLLEQFLTSREGRTTASR